MTTTGVVIKTILKWWILDYTSLNLHSAKTVSIVSLLSESIRCVNLQHPLSWTTLLFSRVFLASNWACQTIPQSHPQHSFFCSLAQRLRQSVPENIWLEVSQLAAQHPQVCRHRRTAYQQLGFPDLYGRCWPVTVEHQLPRQAHIVWRYFRLAFLLVGWYSGQTRNWRGIGCRRPGRRCL